MSLASKTANFLDFPKSWEVNPSMIPPCFSEKCPNFCQTLVTPVFGKSSIWKCMYPIGNFGGFPLLSVSSIWKWATSLNVANQGDALFCFLLPPSILPAFLLPLSSSGIFFLGGETKSRIWWNREIYFTNTKPNKTPPTKHPGIFFIWTFTDFWMDETPHLPSLKLTNSFFPPERPGQAPKKEISSSKHQFSGVSGRVVYIFQKKKRKHADSPINRKRKQPHLHSECNGSSCVTGGRGSRGEDGALSRRFADGGATDARGRDWRNALGGARGNIPVAPKKKSLESLSSFLSKRSSTEKKRCSMTFGFFGVDLNTSVNSKKYIQATKTTKNDEAVRVRKPVLVLDVTVVVLTVVVLTVVVLAVEVLVTVIVVLAVVVVVVVTVEVCTGLLHSSLEIAVGLNPWTPKNTSRFFFKKTREIKKRKP